jgi:hypothetical protein
MNIQKRQQEVENCAMMSTEEIMLWCSCYSCGGKKEIWSHKKSSVKVLATKKMSVFTY